MTGHHPTPTPDRSVDPDEAWRAIEYNAEQLWDAARGLLAAYKVRTGDTVQVDPVMWRDLTDTQRLAFTIAIGPAVDVINRAVDHVMVCLRRAGGHR